MNFEETAQNIIDLTLKAGASDCDVVLAKSYGKSISCRFQKIEDLDESNEKTIGIRALVDQRQAFVSSSDIETDNVDKLVSKCVEMAKLAPIDDTAVLGDSSMFEHNAPDLDLFEKEDHFGGHSHTIDLMIGTKKVPVDIGFIVFNFKTYPNLINFFKENKIEIEKRDMSFSVSVKNSNF